MLEEQVSYENKPLGCTKLRAMMKEISKLSCLSRIFTNHSVRATAITLWSDVQVPSQPIMSISGHRSYNVHPSSCQLKACSDIKCFWWRTSAVPWSRSSFKLRKSPRWSSSFTKFPTSFQIPAASNEQFVFQLSCWKCAGFHRQQFGRFSLNLIIWILFFAIVSLIYI